MAALQSTNQPRWSIAAAKTCLHHYMYTKPN